MRRALLAPLLALALAWGAGAAPAQVATDAPGLREIAARLLAGGEAARARELALALLARDEGDVAALLLLGRAELELGDAEAALVAARRAHAEAGDGRARFTAARIAAKANADLGRLTRAQVWLRRARQDAPDAEAAAAVARDYRAVTAQNPLAVRLSFGIAPSSNVNGGSSEDEPYLLPGLPGFPVTNRGDALALSGLRVSAGGSLSYRLRQGGRSATFFEASVQGRSYALSDEAREVDPDARGSDYSDLTASVGLAHRWAGEGDSGPSSIRLAYGHSRYGGEPYTRFARVTYTRRFRPTPVDSFDMSLALDWVERRTEIEGVILVPSQPDVPFSVDIFEEYGFADAQGTWTRELPSRDRVSLTFGAQSGLGELADVTYDGVTLGAGYDWGRLPGGVTVAVSSGLEWRNYDLTNPNQVEDARHDFRRSVRLGVGLPRFDVFGFYPSLSVEASRTESDVGRYDRNALIVDLGFRSSF